MYDILDDGMTYEIVKKNPNSRINSDLNCLLKRWKNNSYISNGTYYHLKNSGYNLPRAYGLPKVHKTDCPLRLIISCTSSTLYNIAKFLHHIIKKSISSASSGIENSCDLVRSVEGRRIPDGYTLISLYVISLFTNVPRELILDSIRKR